MYYLINIIKPHKKITLVNIYHLKKMENIQEQNLEQVKIQSTVAYSDLVKKLRQISEPKELIEQVQEKPKTKGFINVSKTQKQSNTMPQNQTDTKPRLPRLPRLSHEEYQKRLTICQSVFMNELKVYLRDEIKTKENNEVKKSEKTKTTDKPNKIQMTNLEQIQSGSRSVNIIRVINSRIEPSKMVYFINLLKNRQMNFVEHLTEFMDKYNVRTTYKSLNTIILHSPYIIV